MFIDQANVYVKGGDGGNGMIAFRREKYVPKGGAAGGDGGKGGDVIFRVDEGLNTLLHFRYNRHFKAGHGENGMSKGKHGKNADPFIVEVPPGTVVYDDDTRSEERRVGKECRCGRLEDEEGDEERPSEA